MRPIHPASLLLLSSALISMAEISVDVETGAVWSGKADIRIPNDGGTLFSLTDDLRAEDPTAFFRGRLTWHINRKHDLSALYAPLEMEYTGAFDRPVHFNGSKFLADIPTRGLFRFDSYRLTYRYNLIHGDKINLGVGLTAKIRDAEVSLTQNGRTVTENNTGFVPLINYQFLWRFAPDFSLLSGGDALGASQGYAVDISAALQWHATENLVFRLGYRLLDGGADNDTVYTFNTFHYATFGVALRF